jgi:hypothetical protein
MVTCQVHSQLSCPQSTLRSMVSSWSVVSSQAPVSSQSLVNGELSGPWSPLGQWSALMFTITFHVHSQLSGP